MTTTQLLALLLALSIALNLAFAVVMLAKAGGQSSTNSVLIALGVVLPALGVYFAALTAYH
ncbi:hypothetical protein [Nocardia gipuzkoensis]|jgi:hypothetical protein